MANAAYPRSSTIIGIDVLLDTVQHGASGSDNWPVTWADDGNQYTVFGDGWGFEFTPQTEENKKSIGVSKIAGGMASPTLTDVFYGDIWQSGTEFDAKCYGILCLGGDLYAWFIPGSSAENYASFTLYKSIDYGVNWSAVSPSVQFTNTTHGVAIPTILQMGQDYGDNSDGYVYTYAIENQSDTAITVQTPGRIHLLRVPVADIETQANYEWFAGFSGSTPQWTSSVGSAQAVFEDTTNGVGFSCSVTYHPGLGQYFLMTEHVTTLEGRLGVYHASNPWGNNSSPRWETVACNDSRFSYPGRSPTTFTWYFAPKWFHEVNGEKRGVLLTSGNGSHDDYSSVEVRILEQKNYIGSR